MADYSPVNSDGFSVSLNAGGAITGGRLVKMSADDTVVQTTGTSDRAIGVAAFDASSGQRVSVILLPGYLHEVPITSAAVLTNGGGVTADSNGMVNTAALGGAPVIGVCVRGGTGNTSGTVKARFIGL